MNYRSNTLDFLKTNNSPVLAVALLLFYALVLCLNFNPYWQTNDDVQMLMIAHGIGNITESDPRLIYPAIFWGYIIQALHTNIIAGYTIATYSVVITSFIAMAFCLSRLIHSYFLLIVPVLAFAITSPILSPQFTVTAACASSAAVFSGYTYIQVRQRRFLVSAFIFGLLGFWIRDSAFFLICFLSIPLFPWCRLLKDRTIVIATVLFLGLMGVSTFLNTHAYTSEPEWQELLQWERVRGKFSGYRVVDDILAHPEIHESFGFSANDISMMQNFIFADPKFVNPEAVKSMMDAAETFNSPTKWLDGYTGVSYCWENSILKYSFLAALCLLFLFGSWRVAISYLVATVTFFSVSYGGHLPTFHVHISTFIFLSIAPLFVAQGKPTNFKKMLSKFCLKGFALTSASWLIIGFFVAYMGLGMGKAVTKSVKETWHNDAKFQDLAPINQYIRDSAPNKIIARGSSYPFEIAYRPFDSFMEYCKIPKFVWLTSNSEAPVMYTFGDTSPDWFLRLMQDQKATLLVGEHMINQLFIWSKERLNRDFIVLEKKTFPLSKSSPYTVYIVATKPFFSNK